MCVCHLQNWKMFERQFSLRCLVNYYQDETTGIVSEKRNSSPGPLLIKTSTMIIDRLVNSDK